jgi:hypothetical protein
MIATFFLIGFTAGVSGDTSFLGATAKSEFATMLAALATTKKGAPATGVLIRDGSRILKGIGTPALSDEFRFLVLVAEKSTFPEDAKRFEELLSLVRDIPRSDDAAKARVLADQAIIYRSYLGDRKKELELLLLAEQLQEKAQIDQAKQQVKVWLRLGESQFIDRKKSLPYYAKVLAFPLYKDPYAKDDEFKELYVKAAVRTVELTDNADVPKLRFHPIAGGYIARSQPDKAKLLSGEIAGVAEFTAQLTLSINKTAGHARRRRSSRTPSSRSSKSARRRSSSTLRPACHSMCCR